MMHPITSVCVIFHQSVNHSHRSAVLIATRKTNLYLRLDLITVTEYKPELTFESTLPEAAYKTFRKN